MRLANDPSDLLHDALTRAVRLGTGLPDAQPREGQLALSEHIIEAMSCRGQIAGEAPTGVGKSFAYLVPAMLFAATRAERSILSTESLALQAQIVDKDAPVVAQAVEEITGKRPSVAVLKGWSNYVCASRVVATIGELTGTPMPEDPTALPVVINALSAWVRENRARSPFAGKTVDLDGTEIGTEELASVLAWALDAHADPNTRGDRASCEKATPASWAQVSLSPEECLGRVQCPFGEICKPGAAKDAAAKADVVVTNHAYLAVQAATNAPILLGSKTLGTFRHLVLDECHTMPGQVRSSGAKEISAFRVFRLLKAIKRAMTADSKVDDLITTGNAVADQIDAHLSRLVGIADRQGKVSRSPGSDGGVLPIGPEAMPLDELVDLVKNWTVRVKQVVPSPDSTVDMGLSIKLKRVHSGADSLAADIVEANHHEVGYARWIAVAGASRSGGRWAGHSAQVSPVDVASAMRNCLYTADVLPAPEEELFARREANPDGEVDAWAVPEHEWSPISDPEKPRYKLSVTAVSATLPPGYTYDAGMSVRAREYPSPFDDAYDGSRFFVPSVKAPEDLAAVSSSPYGRRKFDTGKHQKWATGQIVRLVAANGGAALVLAATARAGREYAAALREQTGLRVLSQWDGPTTGALVADWRDDVDSVLVGTRSLMTGVDAPGQTCGLVIIDRVPRAAGNPVDDARVEAIMERQEIDKWAADRLVYVSDAVQLLEQAYGRLIRRGTDTGLVACLDPRLLKTKPLAYAEPTRQMLLEASKRFTHRISSIEAAEEFLSAQHTARQPARRIPA